MGKCTVNKIWFEKTDNLGYKISKWAKQVDKTQIFCIVCSNNIQCDKKGYQAILQHSKTDKHKDNCKSKLNLKQLHLSLMSKSSSVTATEFNESITVIPSGNLELGVYCKQEDATKAELMWTMKSVLCNMSGSSRDAELFKAMFPKAVPDKFRLSRTKMSYLITDALGHGLIDIGSCNIHIVHNAFLKGLDNYRLDVSEFVILVYYFFKGWPKRWEDYSIIQNEKGIRSHQFIKHCSSRWLTLGAAAERILEQWEALMHYFKIFVPKHRNEILKTPKFLKIISFLKQLEFKPEIIFFNLTFQRQEPLIHGMYDELWKLLITIGGKVCKETALSAWNNNGSLFINENLKPLNHYKAAGSHILEKSSFNHATKIKYFRCLQQNELKVDRSIRYIVNIFEFMSFKFDSSLLIDEWRLLRLEKITMPLNDRIDHYWNNIFEIKNNFGDQKYPFITKVVKAALTLSHGSADIEWQFSVSGNVLTEDKTAMSCRMLNAQLNIKQGIKYFHNRPDLVPIDKKLVIAAQLAKQKYMTYLDNQKKELEESNYKKLKKEKEENKWKKNLEEVKYCEQNIIKLEHQLKSAQKHQDHQKKASDTLLHDANVRLKKAIERNVIEMEIAQSMVETATKLRNEEREKETETVCIQKKIEKRKNNIITKLNKKSKID
ncbi:hypothetical protein QTP88_002503 [Uroleucon formosanum]